MIHKDLYERNTNIAHAIMESVFRDYTLCFQGLHTLFSGITHSVFRDYTLCNDFINYQTFNHISPFCCLLTLNKPVFTKLTNETRLVIQYLTLGIISRWKPFYKIIVKCWSCTGALQSIQLEMLCYSFTQ